MELAKNIKRLRKSRGWTQKDLAERVGTTQKAIHDYESKKSMPPAERLPDFAKLFGVTIDELFGLKDLTITDQDTHIHKNSRLAKILDEFGQLTPTEQTSIRSQIRGLILKKKYGHQDNDAD